jgi:NodT family efflux transporter outer membrane factor (OMF) lipoprotein
MQAFGPGEVFLIAPTTGATGRLRGAAVALRCHLMGALVLAVLAGCAADPALSPHETLPSQQDLVQRFNLETAHAPALPSATWWTVYQDPELDRWIERGLADNPGMHEAAARATRARAGFESARAAQGLTVGAGASVNDQRISGTGFYPPPFANEIFAQKDIWLSGSIDFDVFGRLHARSDAALLGAQAEAIDRENARIRLAAAIAHAYFELAHAQRSLAVLTELEQSRAQMLDLVRTRVQAGFDTQVDRRLAEIPVPQIHVDIEKMRERIALARHSLAVMAGQPPEAADAVDARLPEGAALEVPQSVPADLLSRRADVSAARDRALSALRGVDAARDDFYPNVNLTALVGFDTVETSQFFKWPSRVWQIEPAIHLPLFDSGLLKASLKGASADADAAISAYNAAVLQAVGEASDALASIAAVKRQREEQDRATASAQAASDLAGVRYQAGLGNLLAVVSAQASVLSQRLSQVDLAARSAALNVDLALALGGGFDAVASR